ncbi:BMC domain-containing protein [Anaerocolumna aminovalerica]|uniref:BMC domain-containing protein n=1 Tax=Anaerocolumna aminovalerica TaxID=1527 RepID=UPI001C0E9DF1|nr:BMC domain-containing protein [Anaerocolumna aminovalerica]
MINLKINAIGVVEVNFFTNAVTVLDEMMKASDVELVSCHKKLGGRMVHSIVAGETSSVNAAIEAANAAKSIVGEDNVKVAVTISNPHPEIIKLLNMIGE